MIDSGDDFRLDRDLHQGGAVSATIVARCHQFAPRAPLGGIAGSTEDQLMAVGSSLLRTLGSPDVRSVEVMILADKTNKGR